SSVTHGGRDDSEDEPFVGSTSVLDASVQSRREMLRLVQQHDPELIRMCLRDIPLSAEEYRDYLRHEQFNRANNYQAQLLHERVFRDFYC
ncbi:unnamed protein product, partial [Amoebophrya sp. A25]